ncbi:hypothetical protein M513_00892, partial [Trichuris suis]
MRNSDPYDEQAFVPSLRRFIARRGKPAVVYSDNSANFIGTRETRNGKDESVQYFARNPLETHSSGGSMVGWMMLKELLRRCLGRASLTYEELLTVLCDCEAVMISRPLTRRKLEFKTAILLIYSWCNGYAGSQSCSKQLAITEVTSANENSSIAHLIGMSRKYAVAWKQRVRDLDTESLLGITIVCAANKIAILLVTVSPKQQQRRQRRRLRVAHVLKRQRLKQQREDCLANRFIPDSQM